MKLRIRSDSVRLRLGPNEVQRLLRDNALLETTRFGPAEGQQLSYRLLLAPAGDEITATFGTSGISVAVPRASAQAWAEGDELAMSAEHPTGEGHILRLLIEKDLECLDGPPEAEQDVYPNPSVKCGV